MGLDTVVPPSANLGIVNREAGLYKKYLEPLRRSFEFEYPAPSPREVASPGYRIVNVLRLVLLVILLSGVAVFFGLLLGSDKVQTASVSVLHWLEALPKWISILLTAFLYAMALIFFMPGTPFNLAAGFLFGWVVGTDVALGGAMLGAGLAFVFGRTIAREWVKEKVARYPTLKAVEMALAKKGVYIVFLMRLSPLFPFPLLNYAFGITQVHAWQYLAGTAAGIMPATAGYCYLGTLMRDLTDMWTTDEYPGTQNESRRAAWLFVAASITVLSIILISYMTKRAIANATAEYQAQASKDFELELMEENDTKTTTATDPLLNAFSARSWRPSM
jgi:uncharacterized membrane protein YdjX (TVP38/TMEM64 family)